MEMPDTVKITRSEYEQLIRDSECLRIVQSIISSGHTMLADTDMVKCICGVSLEERDYE